jgi:cation diffusion facilitator family transporter
MGNKTDHSSRQVRRVTLIGLVLNLLLAAGKGTIGLLVASQSLVADAVHSLSDSVTDIAVLVGVRFWSAPPDECHPHGHGRIETLITFFIGLSLAAVALGITYHALDSMRETHPAAPGWLAFYAALVSIAAKEWLYRITIRTGREVGSSALVANAWHHRSDALSSVPVALAVLAGRIFPGFVFLDHIAAVLVSALLLKAAFSISLPSFRRLVDAGVTPEVREHIETTVLETSGVRGLHALRTRHIGSGFSVDLHIQVAPDITVFAGHEIAGAVKARLLKAGLGIEDVLIHVEPGGQV